MVIIAVGVLGSRGVSDQSMEITDGESYRQP